MQLEARRTICLRNTSPSLRQLSTATQLSTVNEMTLEALLRKPMPVYSTLSLSLAHASMSACGRDSNIRLSINGVVTDNSYTVVSGREMYVQYVTSFFVDGCGGQSFSALLK